MDPSQIDQILINHCINARDAIEGVGKIKVETGNSSLGEEFCTAHPGFVVGKYVRIAVNDNGDGIMSGYTENIIANKGIINEGVFFIQKPFSQKKLALKVKETLEGGLTGIGQKMS